MKRSRITLDMQIRNATGTWTLAQAMAAVRRLGLTGLLADHDVADEEAFGFRRAIEQGRTPTVGQVLAAWYVAKFDELERHYLVHPEMTNNAYRKRLARIERWVFTGRTPDGVAPG